MFCISIIISTDSASYFLKMIMLISLDGILTQARMALDEGLDGGDLEFSNQ